MTHAEKLSLATTFTLGDLGNDPVRVDMTDNGHGPATGDGIPRWAVRRNSVCLNVKNAQWDYEPMPSSRTAAWLKRHRFADLDAAIAAARREMVKR